MAHICPMILCSYPSICRTALLHRQAKQTKAFLLFVPIPKSYCWHMVLTNLCENVLEVTTLVGNMWTCEVMYIH